MRSWAIGVGVVVAIGLVGAGGLAYAAQRRPARIVPLRVTYVGGGPTRSTTIRAVYGAHRGIRGITRPLIAPWRSGLPEWTTTLHGATDAAGGAQTVRYDLPLAQESIRDERLGAIDVDGTRLTFWGPGRGHDPDGVLRLGIVGGEHGEVEISPAGLAGIELTIDPANTAHDPQTDLADDLEDLDPEEPEAEE